MKIDDYMECATASVRRSGCKVTNFWRMVQGLWGVFARFFLIFNLIGLLSGSITFRVGSQIGHHSSLGVTTKGREDMRMIGFTTKGHG